MDVKSLEATSNMLNTMDFFFQQNGKEVRTAGKHQAHSGTTQRSALTQGHQEAWLGAFVFIYTHDMSNIGQF